VRVLHKIMQTANSLIERASHVFLVLAGALIVVMMFSTSYGVIRRYAFNSPEPYSYEISTMFLLFSFVFAVSAVERLNRHIRVDFISARLSERVQNIILNIVAPAIGLYYSVLLTWKSLDAAIFSLQIGEVSSSIWGVPLFPIKVMVPIGYFLLALVLLPRIYKGVASLKSGVKKKGD
jgi:TRAP-type mannitol/chloroaromatic compound transport system permease small subunit